jgi:hypothetical protein
MSSFVSFVMSSTVRTAGDVLLITRPPLIVVRRL